MSKTLFLRYVEGSNKKNCAVGDGGLKGEGKK